VHSPAQRDSAARPRGSAGRHRRATIALWTPAPAAVAGAQRDSGSRPPKQAAAVRTHVGGAAGGNAKRDPRPAAPSRPPPEPRVFPTHAKRVRAVACCPHREGCAPCRAAWQIREQAVPSARGRTDDVPHLESYGRSATVRGEPGLLAAGGKRAATARRARPAFVATRLERRAGGFGINRKLGAGPAGGSGGADPAKPRVDSGQRAHQLDARGPQMAPLRREGTPLGGIRGNGKLVHARGGSHASPAAAKAPATVDSRHQVLRRPRAVRFRCLGQGAACGSDRRDRR